MTTVSVLAQNLRTRYLRGGKAPQHNILSANLLATDTNIVLTHDIGPVSRGMRVSVALEDMYVFEVVPGTKTITVQRGAYGSVATTHTAGDVLIAGSNWTDFDILDGFNRTLGDLEGRGLYDVGTVTATYASTVDGYDLTGVTDILDVIDVYSRSTDTTSKNWYRLDIGDWSFIADASTTDFASGYGIVMRRPTPAYIGTSLRVSYRRRFGRLSALSDDATTVGRLGTDGEDLLLMGTAVDILTTMPMARNDLSTQGDPRRADEVPTGAWSQAPSRLSRSYEKRVRAAVTVLERRYPMRLRTR